MLPIAAVEFVFQLPPQLVASVPRRDEVKPQAEGVPLGVRAGPVPAACCLSGTLAKTSGDFQFGHESGPGNDDPRAPFAATRTAKPEATNRKRAPTDRVRTTGPWYPIAGCQANPRFSLPDITRCGSLEYSWARLQDQGVR